MAEISDEPQQKRQKPNEDESEANEVIEPKAITNIYYDCLERIFDLLDLKSLLMVADTCKRLQIAAAAKFGDEYGGKEVWLYPNDPNPRVYVGEEQISVHGLKFCLAFLRCFGAKITDLIVGCGRFMKFVDTKKEDYLEEYINQYCAGSLTSIEFKNKSQFSNNAFEKPFKSVERVKIYWCSLENQLPNFVNWFPNVHHLEIVCCSVDKASLTNVFFAHLKHLELSIGKYPYELRIEDAADLLRVNPQLQSLTIRLGSVLTLGTILQAISANSVITKLTVERFVFNPLMDVKIDELNGFVAQYPLAVELVFGVYRLTTDDAINFIRQMNALKRIEFQVDGQPECDRLLNQLEQDWKSGVVVHNGGILVKLNR